MAIITIKKIKLNKIAKNVLNNWKEWIIFQFIKVIVMNAIVMNENR